VPATQRSALSGARQARHLVIDYDAAPALAPSIAGAACLGDTFAGDLTTLCRLAAQHAVTVGATNRVVTPLAAF
jgi:hypothetical protein